MAVPAKQLDDSSPRRRAEVEDLVQRAQSGDTSTLPAIRRLLEDPEKVNACGGDLAREAEASLIHAAAAGNLLLREALTRKLEILRGELAGPKPSPLERLLVERVVACWLQVQDADARYAQATNLSGQRLDDYQKRMDRAHRRYLSALRTLALVRKLALPTLQVNIARNQVNVSGGG